MCVAVLLTQMLMYPVGACAFRDQTTLYPLELEFWALMSRHVDDEKQTAKCSNHWATSPALGHSILTDDWS